MSVPTNARTRRAAGMRKRFGTDVVLNGQTYRVTAKKASSQDAGTSGLPRESLGFQLVATDPRVFSFSPRDFQPYTQVPPPKQADELTWHGILYIVKSVAYSDVGDDTNSIDVFAFRKLEET